MEILFSSSKIKITFGTGSEFAGRSLRMSGEALHNGFDADADSMTWLTPYDCEVVNDTTKARIVELIAVRNLSRDFQIKFMGE